DARSRRGHGMPQGGGRGRRIRLSRRRQPSHLRRLRRRRHPAHPRAPRGGRRTRRRGLRQGLRPRGRGVRHVRPGRDEHRHAARRRDDGLDADGGHHRPGADRADRHRRLPGGRHLRHDDADRQALDGHPRSGRHPADDPRGLPHRAHGSARSGPRRHAGRPHARRHRLPAGRRGPPAGLPADEPGQPQAGPAGRQGARERAAPGALRGRRRGAGRRLRRGDRAGHRRRTARHLHADGARRLPGAAPAVAGDARHARDAHRQLRDGRGGPDRRDRGALRRPHHRQALGVRPARQVRPHRHRSRRDLQERPGAHPDRRRRQAHPAGAHGRVPVAVAGSHAPRLVVGAHPRLADAVSAGLRGHPGRRDQAAARRRGALRGDQRRLHHLLRRRPAPDVGGAVLPLQAPAHVDQLRRPGDDGLRPARRDRRPDGQSGRARVRHLGRRLDPDEYPGAGHLRRVPDPDQGVHPQQRLLGHGPPVAGDVLEPPLLARRDGP
ncbi:MAG: Acetolactate synthase large subunit, partial [uncultured Solirubrobacteraceae bacterium]